MRTTPDDTQRRHVAGYGCVVTLFALFAALAVAIPLASQFALVEHEATTFVAWRGPTQGAGALDGGSGCTSSGRNVGGGEVMVAADEHVCGSVNALFGDIHVAGRVDGSVTTLGGSIVITGLVMGSVRAVGGDVTLGPRAVVDGDIQMLGGDVHRAAGAVVNGSVRDARLTLAILPWNPFGAGAGYRFPLWSVLLWTLAGALIAGFFPERLGRVGRIARRRFVGSAVAGGATFMAAMVASVILTVTCIGIPAALALLAAVWLLWVTGTVAVGYALGSGVLRVVSRQQRGIVPATLVGVWLVTVAESIPCVGGMIWLLVGCAGLGAATVALLATPRRRQRWSA
jgi:cytoskeletal protein CcmA (bactofilin family)